LNEPLNAAEVDELAQDADNRHMMPPLPSHEVNLEQTQNTEVIKNTQTAITFPTQEEDRGKQVALPALTGLTPFVPFPCAKWLILAIIR